MQQTEYRDGKNAVSRNDFRCGQASAGRIGGERHSLAPRRVISTLPPGTHALS
jgi:hypothetical protein